MKQRRIMAVLLCISMFLFGTVGTAVAMEGTSSVENVKATEVGAEAVTPQENSAAVYQAGTLDELKQAFDAIAKSDEPEAVIELTADLPSDGTISKNFGVPNRHIIFKSAEGGIYTLYAYRLQGDCTFDNVQLGNSSIEADGHLFELTHNFNDKLGTIYGGRYGSADNGASSNGAKLILNGGSSNFVMGGASNCQVNGDIFISMDGHQTLNLIGGSYISRGGGYPPDPEICHIKGDITIEMKSGKATEFIGGSSGFGGQHGLDQSIPKVGGDIDISIGKQGAVEETAVVGYLWAGGKFADCNGVTVDVEDGANIGYEADFEEGVLAAGYACAIADGVDMTVNGGDTRTLFAGGISENQIYNTHDTPMLIGNPKNIDAAGPLPNVVSVTVNDGYVGELSSYAYAINDPMQDKISELYGNAYVEINGGKIVQSQLSYDYTKTYGDSIICVKDGTALYYEAICGDRFGYDIEDNDAFCLGDTTVIFDGCGKPNDHLEEANFNGWTMITGVNNVILKNQAYVSGETPSLLNGVGNLYVEDGSALALSGGKPHNDGEITKNTVLNECVFGKDSTLAMCRNGEGDTATPAVLEVGEKKTVKDEAAGEETVTVTGKVKGAAALYTVEPINWMDDNQSNNRIAFASPVENEVYMKANGKEAQTEPNSKATQLTFSNPETNDFYVEYTTDAEAVGDYEHAWRMRTNPEIVFDVVFLPGEHGDLVGETSFEIHDEDVTLKEEHDEVPQVEAESNYAFVGWLGNDKRIYTTEEVENLVIDHDMVFTAQYEKLPSGGGGGIIDKVTLHYVTNGGTVYKDEIYSKNSTVALDKVPSRTGYQFTGWYADQSLNEPIEIVKMISDKTVYAGWRKASVPDMLNGDDHVAYVFGYTDGTVQPKGNIIRAEVASIFYRLLQEDIKAEYTTDVNDFTDVNEGMWFNTTVSTMEKLNIVAGRGDRQFAPYDNITRAEFAAICARFDTGLAEGDSNFTDISGHWAEKDIERAVALGWISGYEDGTFRPDNFITRAEAMSMINRVLCRLPETEDDLLDGMKTWPDNQPGAWHYLAVQEATNSHTYQAKGEIYEHWTDLIDEK